MDSYNRKLYALVSAVSNFFSMGTSHKLCQMNYYREYKVSTIIIANVIDDK